MLPPNVIRKWLNVGQSSKIYELSIISPEFLTVEIVTSLICNNRLFSACVMLATSMRSIRCRCDRIHSDRSIRSWAKMKKHMLWTSDSLVLVFMCAKDRRLQQREHTIIINRCDGKRVSNSWKGKRIFEFALSFGKIAI